MTRQGCINHRRNHVNETKNVKNGPYKPNNRNLKKKYMENAWKCDIQYKRGNINKRNMSPKSEKQLSYLYSKVKQEIGSCVQIWHVELLSGFLCFPLRSNIILWACAQPLQWRCSSIQPAGCYSTSHNYHMSVARRHLTPATQLLLPIISTW